MKKLVILLSFIILLTASCKSSKNAASSSSGKGKSKKEKSKGSSDDKKADAVIKEARKYTGTPYRYGGTSKGGIDCSGLTSQSFKAIDIDIPRTSSAQSTFGKTVKLSDIKKGDLVFFTDRKGHKKITHVGIITEVRGPNDAKFIHASTKLGVVENDLFSNYYKPLIMKAVRIF